MFYDKINVNVNVNVKKILTDIWFGECKEWLGKGWKFVWCV